VVPLAVEIILLPTALAVAVAWEFSAKANPGKVFIHLGTDKIAQAVAETQEVVEVVAATAKILGADLERVLITSMAERMVAVVVVRVQAGLRVPVTAQQAQFELSGAIP
jgi:hypothetical protein